MCVLIPSCEVSEISPESQRIKQWQACRKLKDECQVKTKTREMKVFDSNLVGVKVKSTVKGRWSHFVNYLYLNEIPTNEI